jgi:hypothetical protein
MAGLIECKACGASVSKKAPSCPQCGEPLKRKPIGCGSGIVIVIVVFVITTLIFESSSPTGTSGNPTTSSNRQSISANCTKQGERKALIQNMIAEGYWQKVERPASLYHVWVMPSFVSGTTFDNKKSLLSMVSAYSICEGGDSLVIVYDAITGKKIGDFSELGLDLD